MKLTGSRGKLFKKAINMRMTYPPLTTDRKAILAAAGLERRLILA